MLRSALLLALLARIAAAGPHVEPVAWGRLALYTAPTGKGLHPQDRLKIEFVQCTYDDTVEHPKQHCTASDRAHANSAGNPFSDPSWVWAAKQFKLEDAAIPAVDVRTLEDGGALAKDPSRVVILHTESTGWIPEIKTEGCESAHGHPCDPLAVPTGRKIRSTGKGVSAIWWVTYPTPYNLEPLAERLGFTVERPETQLLRIVDSPHAAKLEKVFQGPVFWKEVLAYLATARDDDPAIAAALAYDRALIAAQLRDATAFAEAYKQLDVKKLPRALQKAPVLAVFKRIVAGKLSLTAPDDLETVLAHDP